MVETYGLACFVRLLEEDFYADGNIILDLVLMNTDTVDFEATQIVGVQVRAIALDPGEDIAASREEVVREDVTWTDLGVGGVKYRQDVSFEFSATTLVASAGTGIRFEIGIKKAEGYTTQVQILGARLRYETINPRVRIVDSTAIGG